MKIEIENLFQRYNKKYIKFATETDFMFQEVYPLYEFIGQYKYAVNTKSRDKYLYIGIIPNFDDIKNWLEFLDENDINYYTKYFNL